MNNDSLPANVGSNDGLGRLVERMLSYSDIRGNDPRESRELLRDLLVDELRDALRAQIVAERERCATVLDDAQFAAGENNDLRAYELLRGLAAAVRA